MTGPPRTPGDTLALDIARSALHRIDAWGVAMIICALVIVLHDADVVQGAILAVILGASYWLGYAVNDWFDAPYDALDDGDAHRNVFVHHPLEPAPATALFATVAAVLLLGFGSFGARGLYVFPVCMFAIWTYSAPPIRLKSRPGLYLLSHGVFVQTLPYLISVYLIGNGWGIIDWVMLSLNFLASLSGQLAQQVRDLDLDSRTGTTFATRVGLRGSVRCLQVVTGLLAVVAIAAFAARVLPIYLAPLAAAFGPSMWARLLGHGTRSARVVLVCSGIALVYVALLVAVQTWGGTLVGARGDLYVN